MISISSKKNKYLFSPTYFFISIIILFFSCGSNQNLTESQKIKDKILAEQKRKAKKSNNNFLAYHNSYYLAKVKFQDAFDLMNKEDNNNQSLPSFTLFDDAIKYALIVVNNFQNTDFFEDASYIIARSSYYKNLLSSATFYFKTVLSNKKSPYYFDSLVRLGFISITLENQDDLIKIMEELESNVNNFNQNSHYLKKKIPYKFLENELLNTTSNYFILKAEVSKYFEQPHDITEKYYLEAIEGASTNNHKKDVYFKLISFFEKLNNEEKVLKYVNKLKDEFSIDESLDDLMTNWYIYSRKLGFFEDIHNYLDDQLSHDLTNDKKIYYSIEKAKTYIEQNSFVEAEKIYNNLLLEYEETMNSYKSHFSDIYFQLGQLYMREYGEYDKALDYLSLSLEKKSTDLEIKNKFQSLENYVDLFNQYLILTNPSQNDTTIVLDENIEENKDLDSFTVPIPSDYEYEIINVDTLLFDMSSILYFELDLKNEALEKLKLIFSHNMDSPLMPKVISFLKEMSPSNNWDSLYVEDFKLSSNQEDSSSYLQKNRENAFMRMGESINESLDLFKDNYEKSGDLASLYMVALIYDQYLNDIENAVSHYNEYIKYDTADHYSEASSRLNKIKSIIEDEINLVEQKISYYTGLLHIENSLELSENDSMIISLEQYKQGAQLGIKKKCNQLLTILEFPSHVGLRDSLLKNNYYHISNKTRGKESMESLLFNVANFIHRQTNNSKLASEYYKIIIDYYKDTELYTDAILALHQIEPADNWLPLLLEKKDEEFSNIEKFNPRTGAEVIEATRNRLFPEDFESKNIIYSVPFDSISDVPTNFDNLMPERLYDIKMKENFLLYDSNIKGQMAILSDNEVQYFLSNEKIFSNNNSMIAINPEYKKNIEIPIHSYFFNQDFLFVAHEVFESIENIGYRYNINNSESECTYLGNELSCYEIDFIPSNNGNSKTVWILEIEDNVFIKIKELEFGDGLLLFQKDIEYEKIDLYYVVNQVKKIDFNYKITTILQRNDIKVNNGKFMIDKYPNMNDHSSDLHNNFFYIESLAKYDNDTIKQLQQESERLNILYDKLFSKEIEEDIVEELSFDYVQSIHQYFYFVEDASISGVELTNDDWLVSYNDNVIVGAREYTVGGNIDIPIMGYDNSSENTKIATEGYCENGDLPIIKVHRPDGQIIDMDVIKIDGDLEFKGIGHATIILKKD